MKDLMFVSETEINPSLEMALEEMMAQKIRISKAITFSKVIAALKSGFFEAVLINGNSKKLDSYELAQEIKLNFRNSIKVVVFLPEANANEGSKFGLVNAEVEDASSVKFLANKFCSSNKKDLEIEENIISIYSPYGGLGVSSIAFLIAYTLDHFNTNSIILETSINQSIKKTFGFSECPALLTQNKINNQFDLDWLNGFLSTSKIAPNLYYLNLFNSIEEKENYSLIINTKIKELIKETEQETIKTGFIINTLKLIDKELEGNSLSLFNDIIQTGSKLSKNFIFDLGADLNSPLNRQLLNYSQNLILVLKDSSELKEEFIAYKNFFEKKGIKNIVPIISSNQHELNYLNKINKEKWLNLLDNIPLIYPYSLEEINQIALDHEKLAVNSRLLNFSKNLLRLCGIKIDNFLEDSPRGILKFLINNH